MRPERQELTLDTMMGPRPIAAPAGWEFDKTAVIAWSKLIEETRTKDFKRLRDKFMVEAKIEALANVLACSLGMATHYWVMAAREIAKEGG